MLNRILFFILYIGFTPSLFSQIHSYSNLVFNSNSFDAFVIKIENESLKNFEIIENKNKLTHRIFQDSISKDSSIFMINAGICDSLFKPIGYLVNKAVLKKSINLDEGKGNFFLKPNGTFLITDSVAFISESSQLGNLVNVQYGLQSGPLLLQNGSMHPQFNSTSSNKNIRCGVGVFNVKEESFVVFAISNSPVTFYEFAIFFNQKFNCQNALCLESAGCVMEIPYTYKATKNDKLTICNYLIYRTH